MIKNLTLTLLVIAVVAFAALLATDFRSFHKKKPEPLLFIDPSKFDVADMTIPSSYSITVFKDNGFQEILRIACDDGKIYMHGKIIGQDTELPKALHCKG